MEFFTDFRQYRAPRIETPSHPGGVSNAVMDRQKRREKESRKGGVYASSSSKDRERDDRRNRDRDRHRGKNSSEMLVVIETDLRIAARW